MNNCQVVEVDIFRNIFSNLPIATNTSNEEKNAEKTALNKVSLAVRCTLSNKKKNKTQALVS